MICADHVHSNFSSDGKAKMEDMIEGHKAGLKTYALLTIWTMIILK